MDILSILVLSDPPPAAAAHPSFPFYSRTHSLSVIKTVDVSCLTPVLTLIVTFEKVFSFFPGVISVIPGAY